jgi:hypothetical protein
MVQELEFQLISWIATSAISIRTTIVVPDV